MTEPECTCNRQPPPCPVHDADGCGWCGEDHWSGYQVLWQLPSTAGSENDLMVRAPSRGEVNVGILHVYDKWLDATEAREMAKALNAAADLVDRPSSAGQLEPEE